MKFNRVWLRIMQRRFERWLQSLFAPRPVKRTVAVPEYNGWTATQRRLEEDSYLANPHAVWLKPDRFETRLWMEGVWSRRVQEETIHFPTAYAQWSAEKARIDANKQAFYVVDPIYANIALQNRNNPVVLAQLQMQSQLSACQKRAVYRLNSLFGNLLGPSL